MSRGGRRPPPRHPAQPPNQSTAGVAPARNHSSSALTTPGFSTGRAGVPGSTASRPCGSAAATAAPCPGSRRRGRPAAPAWGPRRSPARRGRSPARGPASPWSWRTPPGSAPGRPGRPGRSRPAGSPWPGRRPRSAGRPGRRAACRRRCSTGRSAPAGPPGPGGPVPPAAPPPPRRSSRPGAPGRRPRRRGRPPRPPAGGSRVCRSMVPRGRGATPGSGLAAGDPAGAGQRYPSHGGGLHGEGLATRTRWRRVRPGHGGVNSPAEFFSEENVGRMLAATG
jgi:hypothetical protein